MRCPPKLSYAQRTMPDKDKIHWFPMRVTYGRQLKTKEFLDSANIENFLPMAQKTTKRNNRIKHETVPAISNLIFVRSTMNILNTLKKTKAEAEPLRYMTYRPTIKDAPHETITVPDSQMDNFIKVASGPEDEFTYLKPEELTGKENGRVVITSGPFKGVEGVIKRIHGNKRVVVEIESVGGICINFVPKSCMLLLEQKEDRQW